MARPSKIDRLPPELKELIGSLRQQGATIDEIMAKLKELKPDIDMSRSGLGEHIRTKIDAVLSDLDHTRVIAQAVSAKTQDKSFTDIARLNIELLHSGIFSLARAAKDGTGATLDVKETLALSKAIEALNRSIASIADLETRIRKEMAEKAVKAAENAINESGAPDRAALVRKVRQDIYGIAG